MSEDSMSERSSQKEEMKINEELCVEELVGLDLPDLKEINSKIETELIGNELSTSQLTKIL